MYVHILYSILVYVCLQRQCTKYKTKILGENPLVATDARCFMPWIASQYNMKLEADYADRLNCQNGEGDKNNADQEQC